MTSTTKLSDKALLNRIDDMGEAETVYLLQAILAELELIRRSLEGKR